MPTYYQGLSDTELVALRAEFVADVRLLWEQSPGECQQAQRQVKEIDAEWLRRHGKPFRP